ncbi:hypothetical protein [Rhodococcus sp. WAY2]|uniref:hypothetical protein n=1 Tax=Rhodococcus sp. WAY2 TaxID=2663121 RepID=UPI00131F99B6|nr:hypothetical protein [Rhodococcus sp. WAY2]QHE73454.1 hypothetical protein GFS60_07114 [Rhodococcus sp. WAY2]
MHDSFTSSPAQSRRDLVMSLGLGLVVFGAEARSLTRTETSRATNFADSYLLD